MDADGSMPLSPEADYLTMRRLYADYLTMMRLYQEAQAGLQGVLDGLVGRVCDEAGVPEEDRPLVRWVPFLAETGGPALEVEYRDKEESA